MTWHYSTGASRPPAASEKGTHIVDICGGSVVPAGSTALRRPLHKKHVLKRDKI